MKRTYAQTDYVWAERPRRFNLPIRYHQALEADDEIAFWARGIGVTPLRLRRATLSLIRTCHHAATLRSRSFDRHPEIYQLGLGSLAVFYTVDAGGVVIRGYEVNWPLDHFDDHVSEHGVVCDAAWDMGSRAKDAAEEVDQIFSEILPDAVKRRVSRISST